MKRRDFLKAVLAGAAGLKFANLPTIGEGEPLPKIVAIDPNCIDLRQAASRFARKVRSESWMAGMFSRPMPRWLYEGEGLLGGEIGTRFAIDFDDHNKKWCSYCLWREQDERFNDQPDLHIDPVAVPFAEKLDDAIVERLMAPTIHDGLQPVELAADFSYAPSQPIGLAVMDFFQDHCPEMHEFTGRVALISPEMNIRMMRRGEFTHVYPGAGVSARFLDIANSKEPVMPRNYLGHLCGTHFFLQQDLEVGLLAFTSQALELYTPLWRRKQGVVRIDSKYSTNEYIGHAVADVDDIAASVQLFKNKITFTDDPPDECLEIEFSMAFGMTERMRPVAWMNNPA